VVIQKCWRGSLGHRDNSGPLEAARERLNIVVNTGASWLAQVFNTHPDMPSGLAAFLGFTLIGAESALVPSNDTHCSYGPASGVVACLEPHKD